MSFSSVAAAWLTVTFFLAMFCLTASLAGPQLTHVVRTMQIDPHYIVGVLDDSGSMSGHFDPRQSLDGMADTNRFVEMKELLVQLIRQRPFDEIGVTMVGDDAKVVRRFHSDSAGNYALAQHNPRFLGTNILAGVQSAILQLQRVPEGNRVMVVISDGYDFIHLADRRLVAQMITNLGIRLYWIDVGDVWPDMDSSEDFNELVQDAGGQRLSVSSQNDAIGAFHHIDNQLAPMLVTRVDRVSTSMVLLSLLGACLLFVLFALSCPRGSKMALFRIFSSFRNPSSSN